MHVHKLSMGLERLKWSTPTVANMVIVPKLIDTYNNF